MKRSFPNIEVEKKLALANCLMLLSQGRANYEHTMSYSNPSRVFACKTCNREFSSFQALGGHSASHKKPKFVEGDGMPENQPPTKAKTHECSICGLEFAIGQALGGHMRRHRASLSENQHSPLRMSDDPAIAPVVQKSNSRRVLCLDLNLTPLENDLELLRLGKAAPAIDCFL